MRATSSFGTREGLARGACGADLARARTFRGFPFQTRGRAPECPRVVRLGVLRENLVGRLTRFGLRPSGRGRFANTHTLYSHIFQTKSASFNLDYRSTTASDGSFLWFGRRPSASAAVGASSASSIGETFVSFIVGTSARVVDPSIHRSSRAARLTNTLVRSRVLWDLSRPLSSSARGTRAPPRVEACVPAGVWKRGSCRPRVPPRTRPRAGRRPRTPGP